MYALRVSVKAESKPDTSLIINSESANWDQYDDIAWEKTGSDYVATISKDSRSPLFKAEDSYARICLGAWGGVDVTVTNAEWLNKKGNVIKAYKDVPPEKTVAPKKVTISSVKLNKKNVPVITWKKVKGATGYAVYRKTSSDKKFVKVATTGKLTLTDTGLEVSAKKKVEYKIRAYIKKDGKKTWGKYSKVLAVTVPGK